LVDMGLLILDRDGVINADSDNYIRSLDDWEPIPGSIAAIAKLSRAGYKVAIATNQSGLGRGYFELEHMQSIHGRLLVLFPGTKNENNYRLLDARDGWNYLANGITLHGGGAAP
jgi:histidinol-phosphate phosphatase family protein